MRISSQKLYFGDHDAFYDVTIQEHDISRHPFAESKLYQTYTTIFIFGQINKANFAIRGPCSLINHIKAKTLINMKNTKYFKFFLILSPHKFIYMKLQLSIYGK